MVLYINRNCFVIGCNILIGLRYLFLCSETPMIFDKELKSLFFLIRQLVIVFVTDIVVQNVSWLPCVKILILKEAQTEAFSLAAVVQIYPRYHRVLRMLS